MHVDSAGTTRTGARIATGDFDIPSLDGLRAVAVALVIAAHTGIAQRTTAGFGVTMFFFLSGFLITTLLRMEHERTRHISLRRFYLRRALRLLPPFYLVLTLACLLTLTGVLAGSLRFGSVVPQIFYLSNYQIVHDGWWVGRAPGTFVYWSLAVEEHFYLGFPLLYLVLRRHLPDPRRQVVVLLAICAAVLAWRCMLIYHSHMPKERTYVATDTRIDSLLFGCALAIWGNPVLDRDPRGDRRWTRIWLPLGLATLLLTAVIRDQSFQQTFRYSLQGLALVPVFVVAIGWHDRGVFRWLNLRWVRYIGVLSYSIYLVHVTVLYGVSDPRLRYPFPYADTLLMLLLTIGIAAAIRHVVEKPCARIRRRLSGIAPAAPGQLEEPHPVMVAVASGSR